jgi:hypothetical protein
VRNPILPRDLQGQGAERLAIVTKSTSILQKELPVSPRVMPVVG